MEKVETILNLMRQKKDINIGGPMHSGKSTLLEVLKKVGYAVEEDTVHPMYPLHDYFSPEQRSEVYHEVSQEYAALTNKFGSIIETMPHNTPIALNMWIHPLQGWINIFLDVFESENIAKKRNWPKELIAKHVSDMEHMKSQNWDFILSKDERNQLEDQLEKGDLQKATPKPETQAAETMASSMMPTPQLEEKQGPHKYLVIVGNDSNFDTEQFRTIIEMELEQTVAINTIDQDSLVCIFDCSRSQEALSHQWFRVYVAGNCMLEKVTRGGMFPDKDIDQTGAIANAILDVESEQGDSDEE